jgi:hypothetical protein
MRLIGYWMRDLKDEEFCLPQEVVGDLSEEVRAELARYLDAGTLYGACLGYSWCRFFCGAPHKELGSAELTDGIWVWPEGLSHYVRTHHILLPEEFIQHALSRKALKDNPIDTPPDLSYWRQWCANRRSPEFLEQLRSARVEADKAAEEGLKEWAVQEATQHGISDRQCLWKGCVQLALKDTYVCAIHGLNDTSTIASKFYSISGLVQSFAAKTSLQPTPDRSAIS